MTSIILLESARRYSRLANEVFSFSVEQSSFASKIQSQRIALANTLVTKDENIKFRFNDALLARSEDSDIISIWEDCINCDMALQEAFQENLHISQHFQYVIEKSKEFLEEFTQGRQAQLYMCSVCGAVYAEEEMADITSCVICDAAANLQVKL